MHALAMVASAAMKGDQSIAWTASMYKKIDVEVEANDQLRDMLSSRVRQCLLFDRVFEHFVTFLKVACMNTL